MTEITNEQDAVIKDAKKRGHKVFKVVIGENTFIYRSINRAEWRTLQEALMKRAKEETDAAILRLESEEDLVVKALIVPAVLSKKELSSLSAGVIVQLSELIMAASEFGGQTSVPEQL